MTYLRWFRVEGCRLKVAGCKLLITVVAVLAGNSALAADAEKTKGLIAVLQSDATIYEKARACQQLGENGTAEAVPVLARLLGDPKLSAYARSGLEGISDPSSAAALREAARTLNGPLLAGVVNSLGVLRDAQATELLSELAVDPASGVVKEALLALGNISTPESIKAVEKALTSGPNAFRMDAAAACLLAADRHRTGGEVAPSIALYDLIRKSDVPIAYRAAATRGEILARGADRIPFFIEQLRSSELAIRGAALVAVREVCDNAVADALNREVVQAKPDFQTQLVLAIADCHNAKSVPVIADLSNSRNSEVRKTALTVLARLGPSAAPALIAALQAGRVADEKSIVLKALSGLEGASVEDLLLQALTSATAPEFQINLIRVLDNRGSAKAASALLKLATNPNKDVQIAALSATRSLAGPDALPTLLALAKSSADDSVRDASENAVAGVCDRSGEAASEAVLEELKKATNPTERNCWIRVLVRTGYAKALPTIEDALNDSDPEVAGTAITELGHWRDSAPMEVLLKTMDSSSSSVLRRRAIAAVLDLATTVSDDSQVPEAVICKWVERAHAHAESIEDKRRILGLLGRLKTAQSLQILVAYLDDSKLRVEAGTAIVQIAPALAQSENPSSLKMALEKISDTASNAELQSRARQLVKTINISATPTSLFDGHSLEGWEGDSSVWRLRDGLIVGGSMNGNPRNEFLATTRSYTNFILSLEYRLVGTEGFVNSGVQFRSVRLKNPPNEMYGYQADIGAGYSGCLYDESRRNAFLARASQEAIQRLEKTNDWNHYEIRCDGGHIILLLNGEKTVDYAEPDASIPQSGFIGLQIHGGNKAEVSFRNIRILER
jgi:HEAT repeat protein